MTAKVKLQIDPILLREMAEKSAVDLKNSGASRPIQTLELRGGLLGDLSTYFSKTQGRDIIILATAKHTKKEGLVFNRVCPIFDGPDFDAWKQYFTKAYESA